MLNVDDGNTCSKAKILIERVNNRYGELITSYQRSTIHLYVKAMEQSEIEPRLIQTFCRPNSNFYRKDGTYADSQYDSCLEISENEIVLREEGGGVRNFKDVFRVLDPASPQSDVYEQISTAVNIADVVNGFNSTIIAYGQTGAGKVCVEQTTKLRILGFT